MAPRVAGPPQGSQRYLSMLLHECILCRCVERWDLLRVLTLRLQILAKEPWQVWTYAGQFCRRNELLTRFRVETASNTLATICYVWMLNLIKMRTPLAGFWKKYESSKQSFKWSGFVFWALSCFESPFSVSLFFSKERYFKDSSSFFIDLWLTVTIVRSTVVWRRLPEFDEVLTLDHIFALQSAGRCDRVKATARLFFPLRLYAAWNQTELVESPPVIQ